MKDIRNILLGITFLIIGYFLAFKIHVETSEGLKIRLLTINNGDIGGNNGIDVSSATLVYADYTREVFKNSAGVTKIKYVNGAGTTVIADITD